MQNFLPSTNFVQSATWLDRERLGKQRLETADALAMLLGQPSWMSDKQYALIQKRYRNHPAWQMWRGYEPALIEYGLAICLEWRKRGYKDTFFDKILEFGDMLVPPYSMSDPPWITETYASNHRSVLLGKAWEKWVEKSNAHALLLLRSVDDKEYHKAERQMWQAAAVWNWYRILGWSEEPARRVNGRWPYLWASQLHPEP